MGFVYVNTRERWRMHILLSWKNGALRQMDSQIMKLIAEFSAPPWPEQPLRKLTVNLIKTYCGINDSYYDTKKRWQRQQLANNCNFTWVEGQSDRLVLNGRYELRQQIGHGAFGVVVRAHDRQSGENVAIKIIKAKRAYSQQARREIRLLEELKAADTDNSSNVVDLREHFVYNNPGVGQHECLVFEMLSSNLFTLLEQVNYHGFSLPLVRKFAHSLLSSLAFLAQPGLRVIHTDIKPENICIRNPRRSAIKLIDFGSSCKEDQQLYSYIQSRYYRSPEVLLGCKYSVAIDMWSLACVLVEMHTGSPLFCGDDQIDQLRKIMQVCGPPPDEMIASYPEKKRTVLFMDTEPHSPMATPSAAAGGPAAAAASTPPSSTTAPTMEGGSLQVGTKRRRWVPRDGLRPSRSLASILGRNSGGPSGRWRTERGHTVEDYLQFEDLIQRMLAYNPEDRLKPEDGLAHPFITGQYRPHPPPSASSSSSSAPAPAQDRSSGIQGSSHSNGVVPMETDGSSGTQGRQHAGSSAAVSERGGGHATQQAHSARTGGPQARGSTEAGDASSRMSRKNKASNLLEARDAKAHISQQHHSVLSDALHQIGCPESQLQKPLDWDSIAELLERFTVMDSDALLEAQRRFAAFVDQPLRTRRERALQHLLDLLRASRAETSSMELETEGSLSLTPAP